MTVVYDGTAPGVEERAMGPGSRDRVRHAQHPDDPSRGVCGARLGAVASPRSAACPICEAMISVSRSWVGR